MTNVRVFQLARDLGLSSQDVIDRLKRLGSDIKTASSSIDEDTAARVRTVTVPGTSPMASEAFVIRFITTWRIWDASASIGARPV